MEVWRIVAVAKHRNDDTEKSTYLWHNDVVLFVHVAKLHNFNHINEQKWKNLNFAYGKAVRSGRRVTDNSPKALREAWGVI